MKQKNGFTLVELLVVMAVISILAALLLPALQEATLQARVVSCMSNERQLYVACITYKDDHSDQLPSFYEPEGGGDGNMSYLYSYRWFWSPQVRMGWGGYLFQAGLLEDSEVHLFECPDTQGTNRSNIRSSFNKLFTIAPSQWQESLNTGAWGHYVMYSCGRFGKAAQNNGIMFAESVGAFCRPHGTNDPSHTHGNLTRKHGTWPRNMSAYTGDHFIGLGTMNVTMWHGSVHSLKDWGDERVYPWHLRDYYWPHNDRTSWGFWTVFNAELKGR